MDASPATPSARPPRRGLARLRSPRLAVLALVAAAVALELALRAIGFGRLPVAEGHPRFGWITVPSQDKPGRFGEGLSINSYGMRDREWAPPGNADAAPAERREREGLTVALLGDSRLFGSGVPVEQTIARALERNLAARERDPATRGRDPSARATSPAPRAATVMNFAQLGYGFRQLTLVYEDLARRWRPDVVVACAGSASIRPMFPPYERRDFPFRRLFTQTAIFDALDQYVLRDSHSFDRGWQERGLLAEAEAARASFELIRADALSGAADALWAEAAREVASLAAAVERDGARFVLVVLPRIHELAPSSRAAWIARWSGLAEASGVTLIDARDALAAAEDPFLERDPEHLSASGHRAVADAILREVLASGD